MDIPEIVDLTAIEPSLAHLVVFEKFDALRQGSAIIVSNYNDSRPLYYELIGKHGYTFRWKPLENGPGTWKIQIIKKTINAEEETIGKIVSRDYRKAQLLKTWGIDFSCGGHKTIDEVCEELGMSGAELRQQLTMAELGPPEKGVNYLCWDIAFLANYIVQIHHRFVSTQTKFITGLAYKVAESNLVRHPEIMQVANLFSGAAKMLELNGRDEERTLFPYIVSLAAAYKDGSTIRTSEFTHVSAPIYLMQADNEKLVETFRQISQLTNGYVAPAYASSICPILYKLLAQYESDVHLHLHLENNILFPKALELEKSLRLKRLVA